MRSRERGVALIAVMLLAGLVTALLVAHFMMARTELSTTKALRDGTRGFYAAEAGLNVRAEEIRQTFAGFNIPSGTAPAPVPGELPCDGGAPGTGEMACATYEFAGREVRTFVNDDLDGDGNPDGPSTITIPPGELFQGLIASRYLYAVRSVALSPTDRPEALLAMHFQSRLIPLFQFAAFYDKDLEILPGPPMTLEGPVHTNGNLFLDSGDSLTIDGQVTTGGRLFQGRKNSDTCTNSGVAVHDLSGPLSLPACPGATRVEYAQADVDGTNSAPMDWEGMIRVGVDPVAVPPPDILDPTAGALYWDSADLRIMLDLVDVAAPIKVYQPVGVDWTLTADLASDCPAAAGSTSGVFYNHREVTGIEMLEIDVQELMDCIEGALPTLMGGKSLDDTTHGGLVWYFGVDDGVNANAPNNYGVRVKNGAMLGPSSGAVDIRGLTVVTNQAIYIEGDYNESDAADWRPAAFLADSLNVLSNNWNDANSALSLGNRIASDTTIRAAFLAGTDTTGGAMGEGALDTAVYNGGLENYPRFHEDWEDVLLTYRGSFVSLDRPRHVDGRWEDQSYDPPDRDWGFELRFRDPVNLPPLTPRFVHLAQDLFVREFEY